MSKRIVAAVLAAIVSVIGVTATAAPADAGVRIAKRDTSWD